MKGGQFRVQTWAEACDVPLQSAQRKQFRGSFPFLNIYIRAFSWYCLPSNGDRRDLTQIYWIRLDDAEGVRLSNLLKFLHLNVYFRSNRRSIIGMYRFVPYEYVVEYTVWAIVCDGTDPIITAGGRFVTVLHSWPTIGDLSDSGTPISEWLSNCSRTFNLGTAVTLGMCGCHPGGGRGGNAPES